MNEKRIKELKTILRISRGDDKPILEEIERLEKEKFTNCFSIRLNRTSFRFGFKLDYKYTHIYRNWNNTQFYFEIWKNGFNRWHLELFILGKPVILYGHAFERISNE